MVVTVPLKHIRLKVQMQLKMMGLKSMRRMAVERFVNIFGTLIYCLTKQVHSFCHTKFLFGVFL